LTKEEIDRYTSKIKDIVEHVKRSLDVSYTILAKYYYFLVDSTNILYNQ